MKNLTKAKNMKILTKTKNIRDNKQNQPRNNQYKTSKNNQKSTQILTQINQVDKSSSSSSRYNKKKQIQLPFSLFLLSFQLLFHNLLFHINKSTILLIFLTQTLIPRHPLVSHHPLISVSPAPVVYPYFSLTRRSSLALPSITPIYPVP